MRQAWMWKVEKSPPPSRWLEECLAEAFRSRLWPTCRFVGAQSTVTNNAKDGRSLRDYRRDLIEKYQTAGGSERFEDVGHLVARQPRAARPRHGLGCFRRAGNCDSGDRDRDRQGLRRGSGALNRWPARSGVPPRSTCGFGGPVVHRSDARTIARATPRNFRPAYGGDLP